MYVTNLAYGVVSENLVLLYVTVFEKVQHVG